MLRILSILFVSLLVGSACVKPPLKEEVPVAAYKDFSPIQKADGSDYATLTISYEDGDGDLFVTDVATEGPNVLFSIYIYNETTKKFKVYQNPLDARDSTIIVASVKQPADGYYKGKSIKGDITLPLNQFRPNDQTKIFYYRGYLMDTDGNRSNVVVTPTFTINF